MQLRQVREYQWIGKGQSLSLTSGQLGLLDRFAATLPMNTIEWQRERFRFRGVCGVLTLDDLTLEVLPKIHGTERNPGKARELLIRMISAVDGFNLRKTGEAFLNLQAHTFLDVFILSFIDTLEALVKRGMQHSYVRREENLTSVRGKILLAHQIKVNCLNRGRVFCAFDEFITDNPLNRIIKATLALLSRVARSHEARGGIDRLSAIFADVSYEVPSEATWQSVSVDRTTAHWTEILTQCRWFLSGLSPDVVGGSAKSCGLLFDMNDLFEKYVAVELKRALAEEFEVLAQRPQKKLLRRLSDERSIFYMKPDIFLQPRDSVLTPAILDTKWKRLKPELANMGISEEDLYQVYTYAGSYKVSSVGLLYPRLDSFGFSSDSWRFADGKKLLHVVMIDLEKLSGGREAFRQHLRELLIPILVPVQREPHTSPSL
jgi:5-methylcytosine-specific restriction enzyme subunit McrC